MRRALALFVIASAHAYVPWLSSNGATFSRPDFLSVPFFVNDAIAAGLRNSDGNVIITEDSDPMAALQAAANTWSSIPGSALRFAPLQRTTASANSADGRSVFAFGKTPELESVLGSALAVTVLRARSDTGAIFDSDVVFNSDLSDSGGPVAFSTTLEARSFDLQSIATHELGHALGARHSGLIGAVMYYAGELGVDLQRRLTSDDVAFAIETYPAAGAQANLGAISGRVTFTDGQAVRRASVVAVDRANGVTLQGLTGADGAYRIGSVPPGDYELYAEPLDGPASPDQFNLTDADVDTQFLTTSAGPVAVTARGTAGGHIVVPPGQADFDVEIAVLSTARSVVGDAVRIEPGKTVDIVLFGRNFTASGTEIRALGRGMTVRAGSVRPETSLSISGFSSRLRFTLDVTSDASGLGSLLIRRASGTVAWTGGLVVAPPLPSFTSGSVVNSAGYGVGAIAPGQLVSIFGSALGPATPATFRLDPTTGRIQASLGDVSVTFDGIAAPLLYVSAAQINVQVPYELAGRTTTNVVVTNAGSTGARVALPLVEASPGIFVTTNEDGRVNSAGAPATRGRAIVVYATGQGVVSPGIATGEVASADPLRSAPNVTATIGGVTAPVLFGGLAPGFVGLMQVNVLVPENAPTGSDVELRIAVNGQTSQPGVRIAIR